MNLLKSILATLLLCPFAITSEAQFVAVNGPGNTFHLHPQKEAKPAFQYSLLPTFLEKRRGNAAVHYGKVTAEQINFFGNSALQESISTIPSLPLEDVRKHPHAADACPKNIYNRLRDAALCDHCDWELPIKEVPFFELLLPAVQQQRAFARLLAAQTRYQIATGEFENAIETLQTGYALAKNTAAGPTYIHLLVGIACKSLMDEQLECLIQQPDAPNLYWAIAAMPKPFLSIKRAAKIESSVVELSFPEFRGLSAESIGDHSDEFWKEQLAKLISVSKMALAVGRENDAILADAKNDVDKILKQSHRRSQRMLMSGGLSIEQVKKLTNVQAVTLACIREFHIDNENMVKWTCLPFHQAVENLAIAEESLQDVNKSTSVMGLASMIAPSSTQLMNATVRAERQTAVLQMIEAIRIFAYENDGELPGSVDELTLAPAPFDPVTGKPFEIKLEQDELVVSGPRLPARPLAFRIAIEK